MLDTLNLDTLKVVFTELLQNGPDATYIGIYVAVVAVLVIGLKTIFMGGRMLVNKVLGLRMKPFSRPGTGSKSILVLGDSTAVGTGASRSEDTIAGRLAADFPDASIVNVAQNGGVVHDLIKQIESVKGSRFDFIVMSTGGNDVWHLTSLRSIRTDLETVFPALVEMSTHRVICLVYNYDLATPLFPRILQGFFTWRCHKIKETIEKIAYANGVPAIELFDTDDIENPFTRHPEGLFSPDGVHPSSEGYKLWYNRMWRKMVERGYIV